MRTSKELQDELESIRKEYGTDDTLYTEQISAWVEALEWVLSA